MNVSQKEEKCVPGKKKTPHQKNPVRRGLSEGKGQPRKEFPWERVIQKKRSPHLPSKASAATLEKRKGNRTSIDRGCKENLRDRRGEFHSRLRAPSKKRPNLGKKQGKYSTGNDSQKESNSARKDISPKKKPSPYLSEGREKGRLRREKGGKNFLIGVSRAYKGNRLNF